MMTQQITQPQSLRLLTSMTFLLLWLMMPSNGWSQTCDAPRRCFSRQEVRALVAAKCIKDSKRAERLDAVTRDLDTADRGWAHCRGQLYQFKEIASTPTPVRRTPWIFRVGLDITAPLLGAASGVCVAAGCPAELSAGVIVAAVAAVVGRLVLEVIDDGR